ncbi:MAG: hypothetical protein WCP62_05985 [Planctomycetota bacterium]|jgi:hypothetical protein
MAIYYIETTIPSFYHEVRAEPDMVARRDWTRRWYDVAFTSDRIVSSAAVLDELRRGDFPGRDDCLEMLNTIEMLELNDPVFEIVEAYLANANKFGQIRRINGILGLFTPELVTPMELLGGT